MHADLWVYTGENRRVAATIRVVDGKMVIEEKEPLPDRNKRGLEVVWARSTPTTFMKNLAFDIRGSHVWIQLVKD